MVQARAQVQPSPTALRLAETAKAAGVPRDQLENLLRAGFVPLPKQLLFHSAARKCDQIDGPTKVGFGGSRGPGKSAANLAQTGGDDCQRFPGLKCLLLRKIGKAAKEGFLDLLRERFPQWLQYYVPSTSQLCFPNSSRIIIGHFNTEKDVDAYLGLQYDLIALEEATQLSKQKIDAVLGSLRTTKAGWRPRAYLNWNPGGTGHGFIKQTFVTPYRKGTQTDTRFVPATVYDNPFINPEYRTYLEGLTGWLRAAWLDGDHDIAAGQFFTTWRYDKHVGATPEIGPEWPVWAAMDYGFTHPTVVYLLTRNDGKIYVVDEYWERRKLVSANAEGIKAMLGRNGIELNRLEAFVAGHDVFAKGKDEHGKTVENQYAGHGIKLERANIDRIGGAAEILSLLGDSEAGIDPRILISSKCTRLIECLPALEHDPHRPEDVLKVDVDDDGNGGDDPYDSVRYGVMYKPSPQTGFIIQGRARGW